MENKLTVAVYGPQQNKNKSSNASWLTKEMIKAIKKDSSSAKNVDKK